MYLLVFSEAADCNGSSMFIRVPCPQIYPIEQGLLLYSGDLEVQAGHVLKVIMPNQGRQG